MAEFTPERMAHQRRQWAWAGRLAAVLVLELKTSAMMTIPINESESERAWCIWCDATAWPLITNQIRLEITTPEDDGTEAEAEPVQFVLASSPATA